MKNLLTLLFIIAFSINAFAQDQKMSITAAFPLAVGDNFDFIGLADLGVQYRIIALGPVSMGVSAHIGSLNDKNDFGSSLQKFSAFLIQPKVFAELQIQSIELRPFMGIGYSWVTFKSQIENRPDSKIARNGFSYSLGIAYDVNDSFFTHIQFDGSQLSFEQRGFANDPAPTGTTNIPLNLIKIGVGIRF